MPAADWIPAQSAGFCFWVFIFLLLVGFIWLWRSGISLRGLSFGKREFSRCWRQVEASAAPCGTCPRLWPRSALPSPGLQQGLQWPLQGPNPALLGMIQLLWLWEPPGAGISPLSGSLCLYFGVFKCYIFLFWLCTQGIWRGFCLSVQERICKKSFPR